ncbi:helix-turn-helix domain-containing protein [Dactylosporangium sp. NBC_01737]|uniref:helix-turn-helix domain-containing protein n=1 Tax=Dactylosporangium sp. NBC_01737 TaxID=2975959 RepID=UPI002E108704|nr:helix-turn-helix domain-containing protein [Dactylosporangium sp. NBC_01737]
MLPRHELDVPDPAPLPFAIGSFEWFGPMAKAGFPHRHTFHEIAYVTRGSGAHVVDLAAHRLRPPQLFAVAPGQVHHWRDVCGLDGWVVVFTDDALLQHPEDRRALAVLAGSGGLRPAHRDAAELESLLTVMAHEYTERPAGFATVLAALLHVLVVRALRIGPPPRPGREAGVAERFGRLLTHDTGPAPTVRAYAARLGVSTSHLTEAVKASTGEPPGRLIRRAQALEARRLLARTGLSVAQVAHAVGFADPAYFCRFFRREVGVTPGRFRDQHRP